MFCREGYAQVGTGDEEFFHIEKTGERQFASRVATESTYKVRFHDEWRNRRLADVRDGLHAMFDAVLERAREGLAPNDLARVVLRHEALHHPVVIPLQEADRIDADVVMGQIENVLQSEEDLSINDSFEGNCPSRSHQNKQKRINNSKYKNYQIPFLTTHFSTFSLFQSSSELFTFPREVLVSDSYS